LGVDCISEARLARDVPVDAIYADWLKALVAVCVACAAVGAFWFTWHAHAILEELRQLAVDKTVLGRALCTVSIG
jgi:hypothetical protein